jgi:hypothetical protein
MMKITKRQLRRIVAETIELDLEKGDVILTGKFKNKRKVVKDIGKDDLGQLTINGIKALNFRVEKHMPKDKWSKESKAALEFADGVNENLIYETQEFAATAEEEAIKINDQTGISLVTDQAFWTKQGVHTGEDLAKEMLAQTYSDFYKEIMGFRPRGQITSSMTVADIQKLIDDLDEEAKNDWYEERHIMDQEESWQDEVIASIEAAPDAIPDEYLEYDTTPQQQGMGRRSAGSKSQRRMEGKIQLTDRQLRHVIQASIKKD